MSRYPINTRLIVTGCGSLDDEGCRHHLKLGVVAFYSEDYSFSPAIHAIGVNRSGGPRRDHISQIIFDCHYTVAPSTLQEAPIGYIPTKVMVGGEVVYL